MISQVKTTLKEQLGQILDYSYPLSIQWRSYLIQRLITDQVFIVYSDGKVGSTTLTISLRRNLRDQFVFHIHRLTDQSIIDAENYYKDRCKPSQIPDNLIQSIFLNKQLNHFLNTKQVYFFSLVRDPVAALISEYCENYPYTSKMTTNSEDEIAEKITQNILSLFQSEKVEMRLNWFEIELKKALDFDIYTEPFPSQKGYHIYQDRNLLLMKLESLNSCYSQAIEDFLGFKNFTLEEGNKAEQSSYREIYQKVKKGIKIPTPILDEIYTSNYVKYFYGDEEIKGFRAKWQG
ncbi:putative capsular polysaccharide synthesis family protein [Crocosphaera sp.]|uniref:putative capsular polysaccharide synthesis family protein n=1 Tax=Crocosphaera sp. TaxID=2729996 RepID=UPI003F1F4A2F|nr:putative capsular polysaccharide synthesis family protein [Crocosphaera sp.]